MIPSMFHTRTKRYNDEFHTGRVFTPLDMDEDEWNEVIATNLTGTWLVSKYVCRKMRDGGGGVSIINISSIAGLDRTHVPGGLAYAASKSAINSITKVINHNFPCLLYC